MPQNDRLPSSPDPPIHKPKMRSLLTLALLLAASAVSAESPDETTRVSYWRDISPIFKENCVACHREGQAEGGLSLESPEALTLGSDSGELFDFKRPSESLLYVRVTDEYDIMPPEDNSVGAKRLTPGKLSLLRKWIEQGASIDQNADEDFGWQPIPESIRSSYALAISPDDSVAAIAHANQVNIAELSTGKTVQRLVDDSLPFPDIVDYDFVQAIAFSPDGNRLATGGFRAVRIWRRKNVITRESNWTAAVAGPVDLGPDRVRVALINGVGDLEIWSLNDDRRERTLSLAQGHITAIAWSAPDKLIIGFDDGRVEAISAVDGNVEGKTDLPEAPVELVSQTANSFIARTADGRIHWIEDSISVEHASIKDIVDASAIAITNLKSPALAVARRNGEVNLVDLRTGSLTQKLVHGTALSTVAAHPTAPQLLSAGDDGVGKLWNLVDGSLLRTFTGDPTTNLRHTRVENDVAREASWLKQLESQRVAIKKALEKEDAALSAVRGTRDKAKEAFDEKAKKVDEATRLVTVTEQKIAAAKRRMETSKAEIDSTSNTIGDTRKSHQELDEAVAQAQENAKTVFAAVQLAQKKVDAATKTLQETQGELEIARTQVELAKEAAASQKQKVAELSAKLEAAKKAAAESSEEIQRETKTLETQKKARENAEAEKSRNLDELNKREQAFATATTTRDRAAKRVPEHEKSIRGRASQLSRKTQRLKDLAHLKIQHPILAADFSSKGKKLAMVAADGTARVFDVESAKATHLCRFNRFESDFGQVFFSDPQRLIGLSNHGHVAESNLRQEWVLERVIGGIDSRLIPDRVTALDFHPDGQILAIGSGDPSRNGTILISAVSTGEILRNFDSLHSDTVLTLKFSPDGRQLASGSSDKTIRLMNVQAESVINKLDGHSHHVMSLAWQQDGRFLASASSDKTIKVWDTVSGQQQRTINGIPDELTSIDFLDSTSEVAVTCASGDVRIYNTGSGKMLRRSSAGEFLFTLGTTSDGARLLTGGQSGQVKVWNRDDGKLIATWKEE